MTQKITTDRRIRCRSSGSAGQIMEADSSKRLGDLKEWESTVALWLPS
jgi:hypothetical protein